MKSFCIHLEDRVDREVWAENEFSRVGMQPKFVSSTRTKPGWVGCRDAHLELLWMGRLETGNEVLIFEDDVEFLYGGTSFRRNLQRAMAQLPEDWDMLYLGASPQCKQERYSDNLFRAKECVTTHAIVWNVRCGGAVDFINHYEGTIGKVDVFFKDVIQPKFNCFLTYPILCTQHEGLGTDTCIRSDVSTIVKNYNKYCNA